MSDSAITGLRAPFPTGADGAGEPLILPDPWEPPPRPAVPVLAAIVPVVGAVAIWLVTGSPLALWLAALGPLLAGATMVDGLRTSRRARRRAEAGARALLDRAARGLEDRHRAERIRAWSRHPDVAGFHSSATEVWRPLAERADRLVVGAGEVPSDLRVSGGRGDPEAETIRQRAARLTDAPVTVRADAGIAVTGSDLVARSVVRALALQLCLAHPPGALRIVGPLTEHPWAEQLPHRSAMAGRALALPGPGEQIPAEADIVLARTAIGHPPPPRCAALLDVRGLSAWLDTGHDGHQLTVEAVGEAQALSIAADLRIRAGAAFGTSASAEPVPLGSLLAQPAPGDSSGSLPAVIGRGDGAPIHVDLVTDGPHAVVGGVTGSGKSELLITWIVSLCAAHSTRSVSFLLADFKGGTAFDALRGLPHVTGVLTDLDGAGAHRAIASLRAEIRWREHALAEAGVRDIADPRVTVPRLVIVVDEFAALLAEQPELHAVFADVAARGRALGMHLILGTQRVSGVVRDALLANCPLRLSLRVTDRADSRAVIGSDAAAEIPGGVDGRGVAYVRRAADAAPVRARIALTSHDDIAAVAERADGPPPRRPWLPALPRTVRLDEIAHPSATPGEFALGRADDPAQQRQPVVRLGLGDRGILVIGGPGSGRSTALETLVAQARDVVRIGPAPERAWDVVARAESAPAAEGTLVILDDLDALLMRFPADYAQEFVERLERMVRVAAARGVFVAMSTQRLTGAVARIADLLPRRLLLRTGSRAEHFAAGGDPAQFAPDAPAGRGHLDGRCVQVAVSGGGEGAPDPRASDAETAWVPRALMTGYVARRSAAARHVQGAWEREGVVVLTVDDFAAGRHPGAPSVVCGEPEDWQRHWRVLADVRADHDLVVDASCAAEMRLITGSRALPPYVEPGRGRAWLISAGDGPVRITLPTDDRSAQGSFQR